MAPSCNPEAMLHEGIQDDDREVSDLWRDALQEYKGVVGFDLEKKFDSMQQIIDQGVQDLQNLRKSRYDDKKGKKLLNLFLNNMEYIEKGSKRLVMATSPMLLPGPTISTAVTYFLAACRRIQADYQMLIAFFEDMNSFLQRIVILEARMPRHKAYQNCLMDVFASFLTMCGYAHKYVVLGRFKRWIESLMYGEDGELTIARKTMDDRLTRLQNATEFAILGNTEELKRLTSELGENQHNHGKLLEEHRLVLDDIEGTTQNIAKDMARLLVAVQEQGPRGQLDQDEEKQAKMRMAPTANRIRNILPWVEGDRREYNLIKMRLLPGSCSWVFSHPTWNEWYKHEGEFPYPVLSVLGPPGTGKSYLAACVYDRLSSLASKDPEGHTCVAHFYFRAQGSDDLHSAIITAINQVAEQSEHLCDLLNIRCSQDDFAGSKTIDLDNWRDLFRLCLSLCFNKDSKYQLYLVLDGIDELESDEISEILEFFKMVGEQELRILVFQTSRPVIPVSGGPMYTIEVTKENQLGDIRSLIWSRLDSLNSLRSFSGYVKQRIADKVEEVSPNILYAEHMLDWLNSLGREGAVLINLERPLPSNLSDQYASLYESSLRNLSPSNQELAKMLLYLIAFAMRPVELQEASSFMQFFSGKQEFDIEGLLQPLASILQVGDYGSDAEERAEMDTLGGSLTAVQDIEKFTSNGRDSVYDESKLLLKFKERSMRSFLLTGSETENGSRWPSSKADLRLYLATARLCTRGNETGTPPELGRNAKSYCIQSSLFHWGRIDLNEHSTEEQIEVTMALWKQLASPNDFASTIERFGERDSIFPDQFCDKMRQWAEIIHAGHLPLPADAARWWQETGPDPQRVFLSLAQSHTLNIYQAPGLDKSSEALYCLRDAISLANIQSTVIKNARKWFPEESRKTLKGVKLKSRLNRRKVVLGLVELFDTNMTGTAYRAVAELLLEFKYRGPAELICRKAVELIPEDSPLEMFKSLTLMAVILLKRNRFEEANEYASRSTVPDYLEDDSIPSGLRFTALVTKARIETKTGRKEAAAKSFRDAKNIDPSAFLSGDVLDDELCIYTDDGIQAEALNTLQQWTPLERLTWITWRFSEGDEMKWIDLLEYAAQRGEAQLVIDIYEEAARHLSIINAEPPILVAVAKILMELGNLEAARQVMDKVFDSRPNGWAYAVTNVDPSELGPVALGAQCIILYNIFLKSADPRTKMEILEDAKSLTKRPLLLDTLQSSDSEMQPYRAALTQMIQKMGPLMEFQESLQTLILSCVNGLRDDEEWNDFWSWTYFPKAMHMLKKALPESDVKKEVIRALNIIISAKFSAIQYPAKTKKSGMSEDEEFEEEVVAAIDEMDGEDADGEDADGEDADGEDADGEDADDEDADGEDADGEDADDEDADGEDVDGADADDKDADDEEADDEDDDDEDKTDDELDCILDESEVEAEEEGDEGPNQNSDNAAVAVDEGDLNQSLAVTCMGTCQPRVTFDGWGSKTAYTCFTCDTFLCEDCYQRRVTNDKLPGRQFCGQKHEFWKAPMKGWRGIKDGKIRIEGQEDLDFVAFLDSIPTDLLKRAWDTIWLKN